MSDRLACFFNWLTTDGLAEPAGGWIDAIRKAGYDGIQLVEPADPTIAAAARAAGLRLCGSGRVNEPADAWRLAIQASTLALECLTLHVGWGIEDDAYASVLIETVLKASAATGVPLFVETHRATIFQDMWRTVQFARRYPALRFNGDFSHWYTGQEMVYGGFDRKLAFIEPVLQRTRFIHGRISDPGSIQVCVGDDALAPQPSYVQHFCTMWKLAFRHTLEAEDTLIFAVELLSSSIFYSRAKDGVEECDRWRQALRVTNIARQCFQFVHS